MAQQQEEQIKDLSGDLQTARRETVSSKQRVEVEKFKSSLEGQKANTKADAKIAAAKIQDVVKLQQEKSRAKSGKPRKES